MDTSFTVTPFQEGLFALWRRSRESLSYNLPQFYHLKGPIDVDRLEEAIRKTIESDEVFQLRFEWVNDHLVQRPDPAVKKRFDVKRFVWTGEGHQVLFHQWVKPFDLENGPLIRAAIGTVDSGLSGFRDFESPALTEPAPTYQREPAKRDAEKSLLLFLDYHHIISDAGCIEYILKCISDFYSGSTVKRVNGVFRAFCDRLEASMPQTVELKNQTFWENTLDGFSEFWNLPGDFEANGYSRLVTKKIENANFSCLRLCAQEKLLTINILTQTAIALTIANFSGARKIVLSVPVRLAEVENPEPVPGVYINTLLVPIEIVEEMELSDLVKNIQFQFFDCYDHANYPYSKALRILNRKNNGRTSLEPVFISYLRWSNQKFELPKIEVTPVRASINSPKSELSWVIWESEDELSILLEYPESKFKQTTAEGLLGNMVDTLIKMANQMSSQSQVKVSDFLRSPHSKQTLPRNAAFQSALHLTDSLTSTTDSLAPKSPTQPFRSDSTEILKQLVQAEWETILHRDDLVSGENFFDAGGDSLLLIRLEARLLKLFPDLESKIDLFKYPSIDEQVSFIRATREGATHVSSESVSKHLDRLRKRRNGIL
jgi:hypothetical protein